LLTLASLHRCAARESCVNHGCSRYLSSCFGGLVANRTISAPSPSTPCANRRLWMRIDLPKALAGPEMLPDTPKMRLAAQTRLHGSACPVSPLYPPAGPPRRQLMRASATRQLPAPALLVRQAPADDAVASRAERTQLAHVHGLPVHQVR